MQNVKIKREQVEGILTITNRSLSDLARELETSVSYISLLMSGDRFPAAKFRRRLMDALAVDDFNSIFETVE